MTGELDVEVISIEFMPGTGTARIVYRTLDAGHEVAIRTTREFAQKCHVGMRDTLIFGPETMRTFAGGGMGRN